jgi:transposase
LGEIYGLDGKRLQEQYATHLSNFSSWKEAYHAEDCLLFPENMSEYLSIDETSLSQGELYTILTNKSAKGRKRALIAMIKGTESDADGKLKSLTFY